MKKSVTMLGLLLCAAGVLSVAETGERLSALETGVIRLHIRAESDSTADQTAKLLVRDAVIAHAGEYMPACSDADAAAAALRDALPEIQSLAAQTLADAGYAELVAVSLQREPFPARDYGSFTLPEGDYQALCIDIGAGEGQNWWCVMYPSLCLPAAEAEDVMATEFGHGVNDLTQQPEKYEIRLKCVSLWRAIVRKLGFGSAKG